MKPRHNLTKGSPIAHRPGLELDALRHRWVRMGAAASSPPRVLREVPRAEVEEHWRQLYAAGKHRGEQTAPSFGHDDHQTWVEVEAGDAYVDPVWRQNLEDTGEIGEAHLKRAEDYAARPGALPPGIALFGAFAARRGRRTLYVRDGNHRALAAHLRGEPGRYYMPRADFDRWQRVTQADTMSKALFDAPSLRALSERHLRGELLVGGAADGMDPARFDPAALAEGVLHEREHTRDDRIALEIAMDHLAEDPAYYSKLRGLEKAGKWGGPLWPVDDELSAEGYEYGIIGEVDTGQRKARAWGLKPTQYEVREGGDGPQVFLINDALGDVDGFTGRHLRDLFRRVPARGSRVHLVGSRPMSKAGKPRHEPQAPAGYTPVPGSTAGLYHKREGDHYVYWHPNGSRSGNLAEPTTPEGKGRRLGYLLEHHRDTYLSALHASEGTVYNPKAPQYTPKNDLASVVRDHETAKHPEYVAKLWAHLPAEHRVHAPSDLQRDQERAEDLHRLGRSDSEDELRGRVRYANWDLVHGALADPAHPDHQEARDWVQERWGEARGIHPVILASLKRARSKPGRATLSAQDKALDKLHPAAVAEGFHDWVTQEHPEHADRARTDPATRRELTRQFLTDRHDVTVRDDGRAEFDRLSGAVRRILGDHPVVVNHHTSSSLRAKVRREGLHNRGKVVNPHLNSSAGVYVTTQASGPAVDGYHRNAVATHRGTPYTFEVETTIPELEHDPDDSDLRELRGRQFVLPHVPPERILNKASGAQLLHLLAKATGRSACA